MENSEFNALINQIKEDYDLSKNQIYHVIKETILNGIINPDDFCEIVYDACSRIATCEINTNLQMRYNRFFPYNEVVLQAINLYYKDHIKKIM